VNKKLSQLIMVWLFPTILLGGIVFPILGLLVMAMMVFFLILSFFKARYWCANLCPRGAFFDLFLYKFVANKPIPPGMSRPLVRWSALALLATFFTWRMVTTGHSWVAVGFVFMTMCWVTTGIALALGFPTKARAWCAVCPMGTLQEHIGKAGRALRK
jgi:ferredoxin-type protein NapH